MTAAAVQTSDTPNLDAIKARQRTAWSSGDYAVVGTTLQIVGETLCEAMDIRQDNVCSTSPPVTATRRSPPRAAGATSFLPTTCRHCSNGRATVQRQSV